MYIIANKNDQTITEIFGPASYEPDDTEAINMSVAKYGNTFSDYSLFRIENSTHIQRKISSGEKFALIWDDIVPKGIIVDVDFTAEDSYLILRCEPVGSSGEVTDTLVADGVDYIDIGISVWLFDLSAIDTSFNEILLIPVYDPQRRLTFVKVEFFEGVAVKRFSTTSFGIWNIPLDYRFPTVDVKISTEQILDINALMPI